MNGDSTFRQQKNFLCNFLKPGFMRGGWALDNTHLFRERESTCYNETLGIRVTFVDNSCCDVSRLAYVAQNATGPEGKPNPPAWAQSEKTLVVLYLNCGLHLLHLGSERPFECLPQQYHYVETIQEFSRGAARLYPGSPQIFMTTNDVCEDNFRSSYAGAVQRIRTNVTAFIADCVKRNNKASVAGPLLNNTAALEKACADGLFISNATRSLRTRMLLALALERQHRGLSGGGHGFVGSGGASAATPAAAAVASPGPEAADGVAEAAAGAGSAEAAVAADADADVAGAASESAAAPSGSAAGAEPDSEEVGGRRRLRQDTKDRASRLSGAAAARGKSPIAQKTAAPQHGFTPFIDVVDGFSITAGQCWASQASDGRHYPYLVPMQVLDLFNIMHRRLVSRTVSSVFP
ncbi:hypothetical protein HYH03_019128 [Edaphochlamys debaryana]|uniref:Uncharacterized protein n=1 Tax=Edaphochlamys debaryana TaxID=47281 RepID=A0A835XFP3_9CHLO|nr:hypothetical protein HYH03_019128 [Edaphochlamys debaryana]|eukprot:KAG2481913.1 hypothetical protein HYH03_019128 [Edaphochlamys debaryana]